MADEPKDHDNEEENEPAKSLEDFVTEHYNKQKVESLFYSYFLDHFLHGYSPGSLWNQRFDQWSKLVKKNNAGAVLYSVLN